MKLRPILPIVCALLFAASPIAAQTVVNLPFNTGPVTYTLNSGPNTAFFTFHDNGGPAANYSNSSNAANSSVTFVGPVGSNLRVQFSAFDTEAGWDPLYVYDGSTAASPQIASINGAPTGCTGSTSAGGWWGVIAPTNTASPGVLVSSGNALTFQFCSDGSVTRAGWTAVVSLDTEADLAMSLAASPEPAIAGAPLTYTATLTNNGPDAAQDATITLNLPAGASLTSATASGSGTCTAGNPVTCTWAGSTASGQSLTATVVVGIPAAAIGTLDASATGSSTAGDPNPANNTASLSVFAGAPSHPIPALDERALAVLILGMLALGAFIAHRRG